MDRLSPAQQWSLVALRTIVGWHFLYEGFYKLALPGWARSTGRPIVDWTSSGYLATATGPLGPAFHRLAQPPADGHSDDPAQHAEPPPARPDDDDPPVGGEGGCGGAIAFLTLFYVSAPPFSGLPQTGAEGAYLLVNKNLVELAAVVVVMTFRTGSIAGLDLLWAGMRRQQPAPSAAASQLSGATR